MSASRALARGAAPASASASLSRAASRGVARSTTGHRRRGGPISRSSPYSTRRTSVSTWTRRRGDSTRVRGLKEERAALKKKLVDAGYLGDGPTGAGSSSSSSSSSSRSTPTPYRPSPRTQTGNDVRDDEYDPSAWRVFDLDTVRARWDVPWGAWRVFGGLVGWGASFVFTAAVIFPVLLVSNGVDPRAFDASEKAEYLLAVQATETAITFGVLWLLLRKFAPFPEDAAVSAEEEVGGGGGGGANANANANATRATTSKWFNVDPFDDPFSIEKGWLTWGCVGYVVTFFAIGATAFVVDGGTAALHAAEAARTASDATRAGVSDAFSAGYGDGVASQLGEFGGGGGAVPSGVPSGVPSMPSPAAAESETSRGTIDAVLPILGGGDDLPIRFLSILAVTSVFAPALEEVVFRGFLLASLTKWLPTPGAVLFSSVIFAGAHFAPRDFSQLVALGMVCGFSYARTRNLLTPMMIHSLWNSGVLVIVAALVSTGNADLIPGAGNTLGQ